MTRLTTFGCALSLLLASCATGSDDDETSGASGGSGGSPSTTTGGAGTGTGATGNLAIPSPDCEAPADLGVRIVGRHDGCEAGAVRMAWSGTGFVARFEGTGLSFTQDGSSFYYTVVVDGEFSHEIMTESGEHTTDVVSGLEAGEHVVEVYRQGEASFGTATLLGVDVIDGALLDPPARPERRIEIFGDSVSCGYGNEGDSTSCSFSAETENHYLSYGAILAREFEADLSTVAWSGRGVVVNYGGDMSTTLPQMMDRAVTSSSSVWDYSLLPEPDLVLINLGTNDFSTEHDPEYDEFVSKYSNLLARVRVRYPEAFILCTVGPLLSGSDLSTARRGIQAAVDELKDAGDDAVSAFELAANNPSPGCDWHPNLATHEAMAAELSVPIAEALGW